MATLKTESKFVKRDRIEELLKTKSDGVLCFTDGTSPYGIPLSYALYKEDFLYFGFALGGRKGSYFAKCKNVCFISYQLIPSPEKQKGPGWWSIILDGTLSQVTNPDEINAVGDLMEKQGKFPPGLKEKIIGAILKDPENSNFFKMTISNWGGKELGEYHPENEIE